MMWRKFLIASLSLSLVACGARDQAEKDEARAETPVVEETTSIRFATFNVSLFRDGEGKLKQAIEAGNDPQMKAVSEIISRVEPDVLLLAEFDFDRKAEALTAFRNKYLGADKYPHILAIPSNTGVASGVDLDGNGQVVVETGSRDYGNDAFGYGTHPGQYAFALVSKYPMDRENIRSFQTFKWKDMPENTMPEGYYSSAAQDIFRLSSKSHVDVPVIIDGKTVHVIAAHPTPPVFDGPEDRNGRRNHDEIRLLADYVTPEAGAYLVDDQGRKGGLAPEQRFVIMGDLNADPVDGDSFGAGIGQLLDLPVVNDVTPASAGAAAASSRQAGVNMTHNLPSKYDTSDFADRGENASGNMRLDYVLPSRFGLTPRAAGVFWPEEESPDFKLVGDGWPVISSDHRLVWVDLVIE